MIKSVDQHLELLGKRVQDRVTGIEGVVTSISFDLYGCIQAIVRRGLDKDGKVFDQSWFDVNRLNILLDERVMNLPSFVKVDAGPAEKNFGFKS